MTPSPADIAEANATYDAFADRFGMAHDRASYVARLARAAMQKRLEAEHRARRTTSRTESRKVAA